MATKRIVGPAIKTARGKVVAKPIPAHHVDLGAKGKRGFLTSSGEFVNRAEGGRIARRAGQAKQANLHSGDLKKK